jgi:hypothetical protein
MMLYEIDWISAFCRDWSAVRLYADSEAEARRKFRVLYGCGRIIERIRRVK